MVDGKLLKGKTSPKLENIEGTKNALDKALEGTGLEATIENNIIIINIRKLFTETIFLLGVWLLATIMVTEIYLVAIILILCDRY